MMKNSVYIILLITLSGCSTVPLTGRKQVKLVSGAQMVSQSTASYSRVIEDGPLSTNRQQTEQIQRVGKRISAAVEHYLREQNQQSLIEGFVWEFNLIDEDVPNAWCMPGGKVAFYTGILPYTKDETGIAVVMGHEIAHAVVGHGTERVSHQMLQQGGGYIASWLGSKTDFQDAIMKAYGLSAQYGGILPYHDCTKAKLIISVLFSWRWRVIIQKPPLDFGNEWALLIRTLLMNF